MTEKIQESLLELRRLAENWKNQLAELQEENVSLKEKIKLYQQENQLLSVQNTQLKDELNQTISELKATEERVVEVPVGKSNVEIDELVKEIEFCIEQLKQ